MRLRLAPSQLDLLLAAAGPLLLAGVAGVSLLGGPDTGEWLTRNFVRLALAWYAAALVLMMRLGPCDWAAATPGGRLARWCWTWGIVTFLVHLSAAFHFYHRWSHQHAFERTREVGGVGEGIYVSYVFTVLWAADAAVWWLRPQAYATRSRWIGRSLHAFMLFIVFNGTIVYEAGPIRWVGAAAFALLGLAWGRTRMRNTRRGGTGTFSSQGAGK